MDFENKVKQKIVNGKAALGGWCMTASLAAAEILAAAGFDWVCIDAEHSPVNMETMQNLFTAIENQGTEPFVRLALNDEIECKKVLDVGATGVIVPMIKSNEDVEKAVSYVKYAPIGNRSFALSRATGYGFYAEDYFKTANDRIFLAIMIEHINAIKELDRIFGNKHIDAVLVGPYDLSGSMGIPGAFNNHEFRKIIAEIDQKAKKYQINMGIHEIYPTAENIQQYIQDGFKFIACGIDTLFIKNTAEQLIGRKVVNQ